MPSLTKVITRIINFMTNALAGVLFLVIVYLYYQSRDAKLEDVISPASTGSPTDATQLDRIPAKADLDADTYGSYSRPLSDSAESEQAFIYGKVVSWDYAAGELIVEVGDGRTQVMADAAGVSNGPRTNTPITEAQAQTFIDEPVTMWVTEQGSSVVVNRMVVTSYD